jgi:hypothetical protein
MSSPVPQERFASRKKALVWLNENGMKVSQGKFYQDCAGGYPTVYDDKTVSKFEVMEYGQKLQNNDPESMGEEEKRKHEREDERRKAKAEADMAEMKAEKMRREQDSEWLHASTAWAAVAGVTGALRDSLRYHFHASQEKIVHVAGGDANRTYEVYEFCEDIVNKAFNDVAGSSVDVQFKDGGQ